MSFLNLHNISKSYGNLEVLHDINVAVEEGEFLVLVGPSGCGKSTLLNMIAGLETITSGNIEINKRIVNDIHPAQRNIAMVFQNYALYPNMTVEQNITFGLEMHKIPKKERDKALKEVAELLQIEQLLKRKPAQLSGGQRQRVAMGRALVRNPDVFLFDEPLSNLDAKLRVDMRTEIKKLHKNLNKTIVYVTHDQIEAMTLSTRIVVMNNGHIQQIGTPKQIYDKPENVFVATFMGSPAMNIIPAQIHINDNKIYAKITNSNNEEIMLKIEKQNNKLTNMQNVLIGIRPEAISDPEDVNDKATNIQNFKAIVSVIEPSGADTFVTIKLSDTPIIARLRGDVQLKIDEKNEFVINMDKTILFNPETKKRINIE